MKTGLKLGDKDSNLDKQIQSLLCYRYTIPQRITNSILNNPLGSDKPVPLNFIVLTLQRDLTGPRWAVSDPLEGRPVRILPRAGGAIR